MAYQRVEALANLGQAVTALAQSLEDERDFTAGFIVQGKPHTRQIVLRQEYSYTDRAARQVRALAAGIGASYPAQTRARAVAVRSSIDGLGDMRRAATGSQLPALVAIDQYAKVIDDVLAMNDEIAQGGGDATLADTVRVLGLLSRMKEEASQQRAILDVALTAGRFLPGTISQLTVAAGEQQSNLAVFNTSATADQRQQYLDTVSGPLTARAQSQEQSAISLASGGGSLASDPTTADDWYGAMSGMIMRMRTVEQGLAGSVAARAHSLLRGAITWAVAVTVGILLVLALALLLTAYIARSMVRPLARLRAGAFEVAGVRLPDMVRRLSEAGGEGLPPDVEPIDVDTTDEIGEVARAFDQVHREALRLAANEAMLRGNVNAMFVNLSRRSQSLVERQIRLIDELEQDEEDADRLASLFQMDHLATRMRRNSENLLVLAGHDTVRQWSQPVALIDVLRAALSEIEQFDRVSLDVQPGLALHGQAVNDVVHLVAELVENATSFSSPESPVQVAGHLLNGGGLLLDITDRGTGMADEEMAHANWRLDNPPVVDVAVSRRMGLFVVARLAARHGIRVRLRHAAGGGLTALVWMPDELVIKAAIEAPPGSRRIAAVGRAGAKVLGAGPKTVAEKAAAAVAAARAPRFGASLEQPAGTDAASEDLGASASASGASTGTESAAAGSAVAAAASATAQPVLSAPVRAADPDPRAESATLPAAGFGDAPNQPAAKFGDALNRPASGFGESATLPAAEFGGAAKRPPGEFGEAASEAAVPPFPPPGARSGSGGAGRAIVPSAETAGGEGRLPIFEAVESDWFRHGRPPTTAHTVGVPPQLGGVADSATVVNWTSPADAGWRAAKAAKDPVVDGTTSAGLPKRLPSANLVPGTAAADPPSPRPPTRSADAVKERFTSFQRGARAGHAAAHRRRRGPPVGGPPAGGGSGEHEESKEDE